MKEIELTGKRRYRLLSFLWYRKLILQVEVKAVYSDPLGYVPPPLPPGALKPDPFVYTWRDAKVEDLPDPASRWKK